MSHFAQELPANLSAPSHTRPEQFVYLPGISLRGENDETGAPEARPAVARRGQVIVRLRGDSEKLIQHSSWIPRGATVKFLRANRGKPGAGPSRYAKMAAGGSVLDQLAVVTLDPATDLGKAMEQIRAQPGVLYVEPNYRLQITQSTEPVIPNDFDFAQLWGLDNVGQGDGSRGSDIGMPAAWQVTTGSKGVIVAVLDTGVDYFHPDLASNVWVNQQEVPGNGLDDDGNGYIDDTHGYDFVSDDSDPLDDHGHGTHVSGTIGAVGNNRIGITGVCWEVSLMAVKVFDEGGNGDISTAIEGIQYAVDNGARIINASWGSNDRSRALEEAILEAHDAGVTFIAAAGNGSSETLFYPAGYDHVVGVAATDARDRRSRFSDFGSYVDLAAPGENIYSTLPNNAYGFYSGTSMATPHVSGVAALVLARHPDFTNDQVENILRNAVDQIAPDKYIGTGRLSALAAVRVRAPLPKVELRLPKTIYGDIDIAGTATDNEFVRYSLEYGRGTNPTNWTSFYSSATPVPSGTLFEKFPTPTLGEGSFTFRLTAENAAGEKAIERASVEISNVHIGTPGHNDILRARERIPILGTVFGEGRNYIIEYGSGTSPATWSSAGVELTSGGLKEVRDGVLAVWDTTAVPPDRFYNLRLTATAQDGTQAEFITRTIYLDSHLRPGWPRSIPIIGNYPAGDWRDVAVADIDHDGVDEVIIVDHGNSDGIPAKLLVYRADGSIGWSRELAAGYPYSDLPVVGDVDGDGFMEIFVDSGSDGQLFAFEHDGTPRGGNWPAHLEAGGLGKVLADLDGDGKKELIGYSEGTVTRGSQEFRQLVVFDHQGNLLQKWEVGSCNAELDAPRLLPAVGNLDEDPDLEIVAISGCDTVAAFKLRQGSGPLWTAGTHGTFVAAPVVGDLDGDGTNEVVIAAFDMDGGKRGGVYAFDHSGKRLPGWPVLVEESFSAAPALGDLDGDGQLEISLPSWKSGLLHLLRRDGFEAQGWPIGPINNSSIRTSSVLGDIDGDGKPDIILSSPGYMAQVVSAGDLSQAGGIKAWSASGAPISLSGLPQPMSLPMESSAGSWMKAAPPVLADVDHNGKLDIIATSIQDRTYLPTGAKSERKNRSSIYIWELDVPYAPDRMPWPAFQGNAQRTGYSPAPPHLNQPPVVLAIPDQIIAPGGAFFPIELDQYVDDPDNGRPQIMWTGAGTGNLVVTITTNRVALIEAPTRWIGREFVLFTARDPSGLAASFSAAFEVRPGYVAPVAGPDHIQAREDTPVEFDVLANDRDLENGTLTVSDVSNAKLGQVSLTGAGTMRYVPAPDVNGTDTFSYILINGKGGMAIGTVTVDIQPVEDPPVANPDHIVIDEDTPGEVNLLANDADADGDPMTVAGYTQPRSGSLTVAPDGPCRYVPAADFYGADQFDYVVSDGHGGTNTGTVAIIVKPVNDPPIAEDQAFVINKNSSQNLNFQAADPDDTELTFNIVESPKHGSLWNYPKVATYYPTNGFSGSDSFTYRASDGKDEGAIATVRFTVLDVNNPPDAEDLSAVTKVDQPAQVHLSATDLDGDPLSFSVLSQPVHGSVTGSGTNYFYQPNAGFLGDDRFTFQVSDGIDLSRVAAVSIRVTDQNTAPVANDLSVRALVNTPTNIVLQATDPESNPLNFHVVSRPQNGKLTGKGSALEYSPNTGFAGSDRFTFKADDGELSSNVGTVTIAVDTANHAPETTNQVVRVLKGAATPIRLAVRDSDGDALNCPILKGPRNGRLIGLGTNLLYTPEPGFVGSDSFTYKAWDGQIYSKEAKVSVEVRTVLPAETTAIEYIESLPGGKVQLILAPAVGLIDILVSNDLINWTTLARVSMDGGPRAVIDDASPGHAYRFYLVRPGQE